MKGNDDPGLSGGSLSVTASLPPLEIGRRRHDTHGGHDNAKMEADTRVMGPQTKEHQGLLATTRNWERQGMNSLPDPPEGVWSCQLLGFQTSELQNCERINFFCFKPLGLWQFGKAATGNKDTLHYLNIIQHHVNNVLQDSNRCP